MDFNLVVSTGRRMEWRCAEELRYVGDMLGMRVLNVSFTGFDGLITAYIDGDPVEFCKKTREVVMSGYYVPRFILKIVPIMKVVKTDLSEIVNTALELAKQHLREGETYRIDVRKRGVSLKRMEIIDAIAKKISNKVKLVNPDKVIHVEVFPTRTGLSVIREDDVFSLVKVSVQGSNG